MKKAGIFFILIFAAILCRSCLFNTFFRYNVIGERKVVQFKDRELRTFLDNQKKNDINDIIQSALEKSTSDLSFSFEKCDNKTDILVKTKKANCVGYSAYLASTIQYMLNSKKLNDKWRVSHKVGNIFFLQMNINNYMKSKFFRDHDFVIVENTETKEVIAIDGTLYDYFGINRIKLK
ncbi:hypothetical protein [Elizabethkingia bruuniana]|uniref:Transglutaminase-like domain-containing protein n=1 Tax=Elizabethkingia bruuniana TaxID=1756149 RepID=A0A7T7ZZW8_9FLAO|nr:hypothetical protein [Elizabethkingia bruuniana]QQN60972.1 hypothetical protein I6H88_10500 [Elizabethkingia bruuniana]